MKKRLVVIAEVVLLTGLLFTAFDSRLVVREYRIESAKITEPVRIALVTDLHSCRYGEDQETLIRAVFEQNPDVVLLGGDIFDDRIEDENADRFLAGVAQEYPCFYVPGNHEYWSGREGFAEKMTVLEKYNIPVISGDVRQLQVNEETISIGGLDDPAAFHLAGDTSRFLAQIDAVNEQVQGDGFTVLLSHRPEYWTKYQRCGFDLILCGHAHGGQWRIPGFLNGLFAPDQGLFPDYAGGRYDSDGVTMIVSRGLARESTRIPRIFNRPELVVVEIQ